MPITSQKNAPLTGLAADMGFGAGQLQQQLQDETEEERRRRMLGIGRASPQQGILGRATPILSPATLSLFGGVGGGYGR
jgi:hypothetical protein